MTSRIKLPFKLGDSKKINEFEVNETSRKEDFSLSEIVRYGFPYRPTTLAYDSVQKILAIGTKHGIIKIYGGAFVECSLSHPTEVEIVQLVFRINEGALISACRDNFIHLWNLRQKKPAIAQSLRFVKERISRCLLPLAFNSKWLLVGTHFGNVYVINLDTFTLSSYKIMWNNAIGMGKSTHPGVVIDLCQNPDDSTRLYIGFSTHISSPNNVPVGHVVCWNLQQKTSETVYTLQEGLTSISWHYDGRQFMCSHCDGSLSVWNLRTTDKPVSINYPHTRISKDELRKFGSISKVVWSSVKNTNDTFIIFSGGMPNQADPQQISAINTNIPPSKPSPFFLTILRGQTTNVLHMDNAIVDFHVITASPHIADAPDPLAIAVLLENDLVMIDLKSENYPLFESLHTLDLHESPVTYCDYITEPNSTFYQSLLRLQTKQVPKRTYSQQENPISGGKSGSTIFGYNELIITGHADGSIKFWDASGCNLLFFYKLRTNRLFDRTQAANLSSSSSSATTTTASSVSNKKESNTNYKLESRPARANSNAGDEINQSQINSTNLSNELNVYEFPFAIYSIKMCCDGKYLIAAARGGHVTLFKFTGSELDKADEGLGDFSLLEIPIFHQNISNDHNEANTGGNLSTISDFQSSIARPTAKDFKSLLRAKKGYRRMAGYQPELVCLLSWLPSDKIPVLTDTSINSKYGLLIFGLDNGLVVIDYLSTSILMNMATADLYGTMDPFQRTSISPKRRVAGNDFNNDDQTSGDYQHQPLSPTPCTVESGLSFNPFACGYAGHSANKPRSKQSIPCMSPYSTNDVSSTPFFHSRSIDSLPGNDQTLGSPPTVGDGGFHDEKSHNTGTLSKTFRTFRSRWSRPSTFDKHDSSLACINSDHSEKENAAKSGGDDNGGSSGGEEINQSPVRGKRATSPDITRRSHKPLGTTVSLNANRSFPSDKRSRIVTTPPPLKSTESNDKNDDSGSGSETTNLSKTWTSSAYNHAKLRGTCSLEYTEHMREKSHKRKAHMVDLRKDDAHQQQQSTMMTSTNKSTTCDLPRSSSNSSIDNIVSNESVCAIQFSESFTYKNDFTISPSVWLGTSTGCVLVINLNIIYEPRNISVVPSGSVFRMCGRLLHISFLDHKGVLIPSPSEKWDARKPKTNRSNDGTQDLNASSILSGSNVMSSSVANTQSLIASTCIFTDRGHGLFMCSPTEIQKLSIASDVKEQISEMLCELYDPSIAMPEAPKQNFFAKIFASNTSLDSDQLFGEAAGKAPYGVAKKEDVNANMNRMRGTVDSACGAVNDTRNKLIERGQKLGEVEIASKQMSDRAEELASLAHKVLLKQKEKAEWWSFSSKKS
ncbi:unnamed protein product [Rotaria socialis]|uniref:V-SNARE coiled-coil homology domain-containing protein n=1 Tax=Rotaria socialis TaxID=392032 RepID=A0A818P877_9BILA|nr:unnamed protein product [Rotaria socialis]